MFLLMQYPNNPLVCRQDGSASRGKGLPAASPATPQAYAGKENEL